MRASQASAVLVLALVACSPAAPPPETPKPPPPKVEAPPPKAESRATWSFPSAYGVANAQLDLGDKGTLQVGQRGRRWLFAKAGGEPKQAPTLAPQDLVDARLDGDKILLLGEEGEVFTVSDPLGPIESMRPGPKDQKALTFRAGKSALLGLEKDGTLHRSTDNGSSWSTSKIPMRPGDVAVSMAANQKGEALVLLHPQRVLLSTDDGASFKPLETPGIGAVGIRRDAVGELFLLGSSYDKQAKLSGGKLEVGGTPTPFLERVTKDSAPKKGNHLTRRYLAGDRVVTLTEINEGSSTKKIVAGVSALGAEPVAPSVLESAASRYGTRVFVSGYESTVVVAIHDDQVDPPATKFMRTTDDGKNWEPAGTLEGKVGWRFPLFVGPSWIVVGEVCDEETKTCKAAQAKVGAGAWQDVPLHEKSAIHAVEFDPPRDRAWILAWENDAPLLITSKLKEVAFNVSGVELPRTTPRASTIDEKGWLRLAYSYPSRIVRVAPDLGVHPALYLPFQAYELDLVGDRGFAYDANDAWETADGGEKWMKVAPGTSGDVRCANSGCVQGGVVRLGWDLPNDKATLVASATQPPPKKKEASPPPAPHEPIAPLRLSCTPSGAWKPQDAQITGFQLALDGDVRFTMPAPSKDGAVELVVARGGAAPAKVTVLGPDAKRKPNDPVRDRRWSQRSSEGFVAVRYSFSTEPKPESPGKYQPVDVELGWYSAAKGKAVKAKLDKVSPFRVALSSQSALHTIVEGGLLFLPGNGDAPLYYVKDNGKFETMPRPPSADGYVYSDAVKVGNKIVLASLRYGDVTLAMTSDAGKTWTQKTWSLGIPTTLGLADGKPVLIGGQSLWSMSTAPTSLFAFDSLTNDPPDSTRIDAQKLQVGASDLMACTPKTRLGLRTELSQSKDRRSVAISIVPDKKDKDTAPASLHMVQQVDRIDSAGNACVDSVFAESSYSGPFMAIVPPHDLTKATLLRRPPGVWNKLETRPLSCKLN